VIKKFTPRQLEEIENRYARLRDAGAPALKAVNEAWEATLMCKGPVECGLLRFPYPAQTLSWSLHAFTGAREWCRWGEPDLARREALRSQLLAVEAVITITIREGRNADGSKGVRHDPIMVFTVSGQDRVEDMRMAPPDMREETDSMARLFIAALKTKNIVQHTAGNKRAHRGVGQRSVPGPCNTIRLSMTRLDIPEEFKGTDPTGRRHADGRLC
jgi:hypothetical protein